MEIRNIYDSLRGGGRLFSVLLTESELRLFSNIYDKMKKLKEKKREEVRNRADERRAANTKHREEVRSAWYERKVKRQAAKRHADSLHREHIQNAWNLRRIKREVELERKQRSQQVQPAAPQASTSTPSVLTQVQPSTPQPSTPAPSVMTGVGKETQAANNAAKQATTQTAKTTAQNTATNMAKNNSIFNRRNAYIAGGLVGAGILGGYLYNRSKKNNRDRE